MVKIKLVKKKEAGYTLTPSVIEPAFGIGRIMYALLEHSFYTRENDIQRSVLKLPPHVAPIKTSILPLLSQEAMIQYIPKIGTLLSDEFISYKADDSGVAIGRRYARTDQLGIPFAVTIDHTTLQDETVTLRERDSCQQVRINLSELISVLQKLIKGSLKWEDVVQKYPLAKQVEDKD